MVARFERVSQRRRPLLAVQGMHVILVTGYLRIFDGDLVILPPSDVRGALDNHVHRVSLLAFRDDWLSPLEAHILAHLSCRHVQACERSLRLDPRNVTRGHSQFNQQ